MTGDPDAPTLVDIALECQSHAVVLLATATDPQGGTNLQDIIQTIEVYPDVDCLGAVFTVQDDFVDSGVEESFGDAVPATTHIYDDICSCTFWPVRVDLVDADGNRTTGRVLARVVHP